MTCQRNGTQTRKVACARSKRHSEHFCLRAVVRAGPPHVLGCQGMFVIGVFPESGGPLSGINLQWCVRVGVSGHGRWLTLGVQHVERTLQLCWLPRMWWHRFLLQLRLWRLGQLRLRRLGQLRLRRLGQIRLRRLPFTASCPRSLNLTYHKPEARPQVA
jgi:hypothetical protein